MNLELLFYIGVFAIIFIDAWLVAIYFKEYNEISLKEHIAWRYFFDYFFSEKIIDILQTHNNQIKDML